jgi:hypothetical protein
VESARLKPTRDVAAAGRVVEEDGHEDPVAEAILDMVYDYEDGDPVAGIRNAMIAGAVFWALLALGAFLLV